MCSDVVSEVGGKYLDLTPRPKGCLPRLVETNGGNMLGQGWTLAGKKLEKAGGKSAAMLIEQNIARIANAVQVAL